MVRVRPLFASPTAGRLRSGFSLIELLVVIGLLGLLLALLLPAVQSSRGAARRIECQSHLRQLSLAVENYESLHGWFPPGWVTPGYAYRILPHLGEMALYDALAVDDDGRMPPETNALLKLRPPVYACPADGVAVGDPMLASYGGNVGLGMRARLDPQTGEYRAFWLNGIFGIAGGFDWNGTIVGKLVRPAMVTDGLSQTAMFSEILPSDNTDPQNVLRGLWYLDRPLDAWHQMDAAADLCEAGEDFRGDPTLVRGRPWVSGALQEVLYTHVLPPNRRSCTIQGFDPGTISTSASVHPGGVNTTFADGHGRFIPSTIDRKVWRAIGTRDGGDALGDF